MNTPLTTAPLILKVTAFVIFITHIYSCKEPKIVNGQLFEITINDKDGYIDSAGNIVIEPKYDALKSYGEGLIAFIEDKKWGFIDLNGDVVIKPQFQMCSSFSEGHAAAMDMNNKYGLIDKKGEWVIQPMYDWVSSPSNGLVLVQINYVDRKDKIVYDFNDELFGAVDLNGREVIPIKYNMDSETPGFTEDVIVLNEKGAHTVFSKKGEKLYYKLHYIGEFGNGLAHCYDIGNKEHFFIDKSGNKKFSVESSIAYVSNFNEALAPFKNSFDDWGYIDTTGKVMIYPEYKSAGRFSNGLAKVKIGEKYGYINKAGKVIVPAVYNDADHFKHSLAYVKLGLREGYINRENKWVWEKGK